MDRRTFFTASAVGTAVLSQPLPALGNPYVPLTAQAPINLFIKVGEEADWSVWVKELNPNTQVDVWVGELSAVDTPRHLREALLSPSEVFDFFERTKALGALQWILTFSLPLSEMSRLESLGVLKVANWYTTRNYLSVDELISKGTEVLGLIESPELAEVGGHSPGSAGRKVRVEGSLEEAIQAVRSPSEPAYYSLGIFVKPAKHIELVNRGLWPSGNNRWWQGWVYS